MARITGYQSRSILKLGTTGTAYGTAVAGGAGDRVRAKVTNNITTKELVKNVIGSGLTMQDDIIKGRVTPAFNLEMDLTYGGGSDVAAAQFFGAVAAPAEQTVGEGDYLHTMTLNPEANVVYLTFASEKTSDKVAEFPSCAVKSISTSFGEASEIVKFTAELLGNDYKFNSVINTTATIAASTEADTECAVVKFEDSFWINAYGDAALDSGDQFDIMSYNRTLTRPQDFSGLVRGAAGNPEPTVDDLITGTIDITLESLNDLTYMTAWEVGTFFKCLLNIEGSQIGAGVKKAWDEYTPYMKLVQIPKHDTTDSGFNSVTMKFVIMEAPAAPTGMTSTRPYLKVINKKSAAYIA